MPTIRLYTITDGGNRRRTRKIPAAVRKAVLTRDRHRCVRCGSPEWLQIDHIVRYADGGQDTPENLRTLCEDCHRRRHEWEVAE